MYDLRFGIQLCLARSCLAVHTLAELKDMVSGANIKKKSPIYIEYKTIHKIIKPAEITGFQTVIWYALQPLFKSAYTRVNPPPPGVLKYRYTSCYLGDLSNNASSFTDRSWALSLR